MTVASQFQQVARKHGRTLAPLTDELKLFESGLDSLGFATVAARLAGMLGSDPFNSGISASFPVTIGDFVRMCECFDGSGTSGWVAGGPRIRDKIN